MEMFLGSPALGDLFANGLKLLYSAHQQGAAQAAANERTSTTPALKRAVSKGSQQNLKQAKRLEKVFKAAGVPLTGVPDPVMQGIIEGNNQRIAETSDPVARDLINIAAGQLAAHFYMARYGTLRNYAKVLGHKRAAKLLQQTLEETGSIDKKFTVLANFILRRSRRGMKGQGSEGSSSMLPFGIALASLVGVGMAVTRREEL